MINLVSRKFKTGLNPGEYSFLKGNTGTFIKEQIVIDVNFNFTNDYDNEIIINSASSIKLVTGTWEGKPFKNGDSLNIEFTTTSPTVVVVESKTISSISGNVMNFTTPITGITAATIGKILPSETGGSTVVMENETVYTAKQILITHNLIENYHSFNLNSLVDGNENVFKALNVDSMAVSDTSTMVRVGNLSGGAYIFNSFKRLADFSEWKRYQIDLHYFAPDFKEDLSEPSWFTGINSLKSIFKINARPTAEDPNNNIIYLSPTLLGNVGWIDEEYNGNADDYNLSLLEIRGDDGVLMPFIDYTQKCSVKVEIDTDFETFFFALKMNLIPPSSDFEDNFYSLLENTLTSTYNSNLLTYDEYVKDGRKSEISNVVSVITAVKTTLTFDVEFNAAAIDYINTLPDKLIRLDATLISKEGGTGVKQNEATILLWEGESKIQPLENKPYDRVNYSKFFEHDESLVDFGHTDYDGCTEDDILYTTEFEIDVAKDSNYRTFQSTVFVRNTMTGERFNLLNRAYNFADFVRDGGITHFNINNDLNQYLDGDDRDWFRLNTTLILTGAYRVNLVWSFFADWRFWVNLADALPYFYDVLLPQNGMNREWMRYLRESNFEIVLENKITTLDDQEFTWGGEIDLQDYEFNLVAPVINTTIKLFTPALVEIFEFPEIGITRIEARHTLVSGFFSVTDTWGWIKLRPQEGEPSKWISTEWDWQTRNKPLEPSVGYLKADLDFISSTVCVVSCDVDSANLTALNNTLVARIQTEGQQQEGKKMNVNLAQFKLNELPELVKREDRGLELCSRPFKVLAHPSDDTTWKNDVTGLAFKFDSMTIYLEKNGVDTLAPGVVVEFPFQEDAVGFIIDWRQLQSGGVLLTGCYRIRVDYTKSGGSGSFYYGSYNLLNYNITTSEGDARIYAILDDYVRESGINFRDSGFRNSVRFKGMFGWMQPNYDIENIIKTNRTREKVRNEALRTYTLESTYALSCLTDKIDYSHLLAASHIFISDYNKTNHKQYRDFPVILDEGSTPEYDYAALPFASIKTQFLDKKALWESKFSGKSGINQPKFGLEPISLGGGGGVCLPASYEVEYDNGTPIESGTIPSGGSKIIKVPDPIVCPTIINTSTITKTGALGSLNSYDDVSLNRGRGGANFFRLAWTNPFGHTWAYTGKTGGYYDQDTSQYKDKFGTVTTESLAFPDKLILCWKAYDQVTTSVFVFCYDYLRTGTNAFMISSAGASGYTRGGMNGFYVCNILELQVLFSWGLFAFNWAPLNYNFPDGTTGRVCTSTPYSTSYEAFISFQQINSISPTASYTTFVGAYKTLTELGI